MTVAHFENERLPGSRVTAQVIVGLFWGTLNAMIIANVPTNTWAATHDTGYHFFSKWALAIKDGVPIIIWSGKADVVRVI